MPSFIYKARDASGSLLEGTLEGVDSNAVADQLLTTGAIPLTIMPTRESAPDNKGSGQIKLFQEKVRSEDVQLFSRQMYTLLKAGVPMFRALAGLQESAANKAFIDVLQDLRESLDGGRELSAALHQHPKIFSSFYISMVRVGELTGQLEEIFLRLYHHMEFEHDMRERIRAAVRYPSFVVMAMVAAMVIINMFVIPVFAKVYAGFNTPLPLMTRILIGTSNFTVHYWFLLLIASASASFLFRWYIGTAGGRYQWDRVKLRLPIAGDIIFKATLARFSRSFALAFRSGVPIVQALGVVAHVVDNAYISTRIEQMREGVERGESILRTAVTANVFSPIALQMIAIGEETGDMNELMDEIAGMYEREVDYQVKNLSAKIEPILLVGLGVLVLILALGIFLPLWDFGRAAMNKGV